MHYDVFNGDADGICALIQLRIAQSKAATLITGIKRDIKLLDKLSVNLGDSLTVLDISFEKNCQRVIEFLDQGASIFYVDHHQPGEIPSHPNLQTIIDTDNAVCTSLLVNQYLDGKFPLWAVTAAYGDNLNDSAEKLAASLSLPDDKLETLKNLGTYINYNGYGSCLEDLHFAPDALYKKWWHIPPPFDFISENPATYQKLAAGYQQDMAYAQQTKPEYESNAVTVYVLPDQTWARRGKRRVQQLFG